MNSSRILIVEDEAVVSMHIRQRLEELGYQVAGTAMTAEKALMLAASQRPDLVLMDIAIKGAIDGIDTAQQIRDRFRLPVVFLTAFAEDATLDRAKLTQPYGFIIKPFEDRELKTAIEIALYKHETDKEIRRLNRLYAVLSQVNQTIVRMGSRQELLEAICRIAVEHGEFKMAWIGWLDAATRVVRPVAQWGDDRGYLGRVTVTASDEPQGQGPTGTAIREGKTSVCNDLMNDSRLVPWRDAATSLGVRALAAVPICYQGSVCGAFGVSAGEPDFFQEKEIKLLEEVGQDISFALDNLEREEQRKRAEQALRETEERYRALFERSLDGVYVHDFEGRFLDANPAAMAMLGYNKSEVVSLTFADVLGTPEQLPGTFANMKVLLETGAQTELTEYRLKRKDGEAVWVETSGCVVYRDGKPMAIQGIARDITERKRMEEGLRLNERNYREIFNAANDAIFVHDADTGAILDVNEAMLELYGFSREQTLRLIANHSSLGESPYAEEDARKWLAKAVADGPQRFEWRARKSNGDLFWAEVTLKAAEINGHRRVLAQVRDITERKRTEEERTQLEAQLRQAQKLEAIGTLAGGIAHDFNNILCAIICYTELAKEDTQDRAEVQDALTDVLKASDRAKELVKQILAFSRQTKQERKPTALQMVVKEAMGLLRSTLPATIEIVTQLGSDLPLVLADQTQIHQVLMNLCTNAAHAMRGHVGRLEVRLEALQVDGSFVRLHPDLCPGPHVRLTVSDTGHGMDAATLNQIFVPFFTTKGPGEGTGLGLAMVHGIVKEHQGAIYVSSRPGHGSVFELYFPALTADEDQEENAPHPIILGHGEKVLFVDDEPALCKVGVSIMQRLGYWATPQSNPRAALELFQSQPHAFDVVLTDLTMPGMTGIDLAEAILKTRPEIPVLLASGLVTTEMVAKAQSAGIRDVILKPLNLVILGEALHRALQPKVVPAALAD